MKKITSILCYSADKWWFWALTVAVCVGLEAWALYFQVVLDYFPCELCIYTRLWLSMIALVGFFGLFLHRSVIARKALLVLLLLATAGLSYITFRVMGVDYGFGPPTACTIESVFPDWLRLDHVFPLLFEVLDSCQASPIVVWGLSMADGLTGVSLGFLTVFTCSLVGEFKR